MLTRLQNTSFASGLANIRTANCKNVLKSVNLHRVIPELFNGVVVLGTCTGLELYLSTVFKYYWYLYLRLKYWYWYLHKLHHSYVPIFSQKSSRLIILWQGMLRSWLMLNGWLVGPSHWHAHRQTLEPKLLQPAARTLRAPASSAPVQRVLISFSQGDIILKPHRARLSDTLLSKLMVLKCNDRSNMQWRVTVREFWKFVNYDSFWL